jgi:hypothetical protein
MQPAIYAGLRAQTSSAAVYGFSRLNSHDYDAYHDFNTENEVSSEQELFRKFLLVCFLFVLLVIFAFICCMTFLLTGCERNSTDASYLVFRTRFYWANVLADDRQGRNTGHFRTNSERMEYVVNNIRKTVSRVNVPNISFHQKTFLIIINCAAFSGYRGK